MSTIIRIADCGFGDIRVHNENSSISYMGKMTQQIANQMTTVNSQAVYAKAKFDKRTGKFNVISFVKDQKWRL